MLEIMIMILRIIKDKEYSKYKVILKMDLVGKEIKEI
jgi:hypothetical protein